MIILKPEAVVRGHEVLFDHAICIVDGIIESIQPTEEIHAGIDDEIIDLPAQLVMPGLVNAHQHGRGLSTVRLGFADEPLEPWIARKRLRAPMDPAIMVLFAAMRLAASGVTATIQANSPYGSGEYLGEIEAAAKAYSTVGLRAMIGIGAMDRAHLVYPADEEPAFIDGLPPHLRGLVAGPPFELYAGDAAATQECLAYCREQLASPLISFCYAPAGPQWVSDGLLRALAEDAERHKVGLHMHGLESHAQAVALRHDYPTGFMAHLSELGAVSDRLSIAHGVWLTEEDVDIICDQRATIVRNASSNLRLHAGVAPMAHYLDRGASIAVGTDNSTLHNDEDLFSEIRLAAALARSPYGAASPLSPDRMLDMATANGARAMMLEGETGRLVPGYSADLIALSLDRIRYPCLDEDIPLLDAVWALADSSAVRMTMVNGRIIYRDGEFPELSIEEAAQAAADNANRTRRRPNSDAGQVIELVSHVGAFYRERQVRLTSPPWAPIADK